MNYRYLTGPDDPAFADVLRIYHEAFDRASREPDERLVQELRGEFRLPFRFLVAEDDQVRAFARFCRLPESRRGFLIHIAADRNERGRGVGSELLKGVIEAVQPEPLLVEIEKDGRVHDWYVRHGFQCVTNRYTQPALHEDTAPVPYALYASREVKDRGQIIRDFYREAWELGDDHPFVLEAYG